MVELRYAGLFTDASLSEQAQIADLQAFVVEQRLFLVSTSGAYGELASWEWTGRGLVLRDTETLDGAAALPAPGGLAVHESGGQGAFYSFGGAWQGLRAYHVSTTGQIVSDGDQGAGARTLETVLEVQTGAGLRVIGAGRTQDGLTLWQGGADGVTAGTDVAVGTPGSGTDVPDMGHLRVAGRDYLLTVDPAGDALQSWRITAQGGLELADSATPASGLWVNTPVALETVQMAGQGYAIVAASDSGSLSVVRLGPLGQLWVTDHVLDDRSTRFDGVSVLETVTVDDRVFVLASGADDGVTLMTLMPDGRLLALDSLESTANASLEDITALEAVVTQGGLTVFAAAEGFEGVAVLSVDLGSLAPVLQGSAGRDVLTGDARADMIDGGAGADEIHGGAGDDILAGGGGADTLFGGEGADIFVFTADGETDRIADFERGTDRIDLSGMGRAYTLDALTFQTIAGGVRITFGGEALEVMSASGESLTRADFTLDDLFGMAHAWVAPLPAQAQHLTGAGQDDVLTGDALADTIEGGGGADLLIGGAGADLLIGDGGEDVALSQVVRLFQATLGRMPGESGLQAWAARIEAGTAPEQIAAELAASQEFRARNGAEDDAEFVTQLFQNVLGRAPSEAGLAAWTAQLEAGMTRAEMVWHFADSPEFVNAMRPATLERGLEGAMAELTDEVFRLFRATLGRDPGEAGLIGWAQALAEGTPYLEVVADFVSSEEFRQVYGETTDAEFVDLLYLNVLGRPPAETGRAAWLAQLEGGMSREDMVAAFAGSAEFVLRSTPDLVEFMRAGMVDDTLEGGAGNDLLFGGMGADSFVFDAEQAGHDRVVAIEAWDTVVIENAPWADAAALMGALEQQGSDVVLTLGQGSVTFEDTTLAQLSEEMFLLP